MQKLGRGDISELLKPPGIKSLPNHHCPTCGELIPLTSPTKLFGYGSVRSLDTAASLDCPSCSLQLQERPRKRPSTERMLLPEVAKTVHSRASPGGLLLKSSLLLGTLGLGIYFWPQLQSWIPHKYLAIFPLAVESPILQVKSEPIGAIVRIDGQLISGGARSRHFDIEGAQKLDWAICWRGPRRGCREAFASLKASGRELPIVAGPPRRDHLLLECRTPVA